MRRFVWYSPNLDVIVFQCIMPECLISFEWAPEDSAALEKMYPEHPESMMLGVWIPLGEL